MSDSDWEARLPEPREFVLDNGLRVIALERRASALAELRFVLAQGFAAEARERSGLAGLAMAMFGEGAVRVGGARLDAAQESLGAAFGGRALADGAMVEASALAANLPDVLSLCARLLANPEFDAGGFEQVREKRLALIAREQRNPLQLATRLLPAALYGDGHPYARPLSGSGSAQSVAVLTADDLRAYYAAGLSPERVTLVMAGPLTIDEARLLLESTLGRWRSPAATPSMDAANRASDAAETEPAALLDSRRTAANPATIALVDRPEMKLAALVMGLPTVPRNSTAVEALMTADAILAGTFASRLNLKLREARGWTYGVRSSLIDARIRGAWLISTFVRCDCAAAAMREIAAELRGMAGARPCSPDEVRRAVNYLVARAPATYETCGQIADIFARDVICGLPSDYRRKLSGRLRALDDGAITEVCRQILARSAPRWMVAADAADAERQLHAAGITEITMLAPDALP